MNSYTSIPSDKKMPTSYICEKPGCTGGPDGTRYETKQCSTIELAQEELKIHLNSFHVTSMKCRKCNSFETDLATVAEVTAMMNVHLNMCVGESKDVRNDSPAGKPGFKVNDCKVDYKDGQPFEAFEIELSHWVEMAKKVVLEDKMNVFFAM